MKVGRTIKLFRNSVLVMLLSTGVLFAQSDKSSTVPVSQEFLNSTSRAFEEVVLLRTVLAAQQKAIKALEEQSVLQEKLITSEKALNESLSREIKVKDEQIAAYRKLTCDKWSFLFIFSKKRCK